MTLSFSLHKNPEEVDMNKKWMNFSILAAPSQGYIYAELCRTTYYLCWNYLIFCSTELYTAKATEWPTASGKTGVKPGISKSRMANSIWKFVYFCLHYF